MARRLLRLLLSSFVLLALVLLVRRTVHLREHMMNVVPSPDPWPPIADSQVAPLLSPQPTARPAPPPGHADTPPDTPTDTPPDTQPDAMADPEPRPEPGAPAAPSSWVAAAEGGCPPTNPIKAKNASGIYHLPGMLNYERTRPDRCYADESAAIADGFTKAKR